MKKNEKGVLVIEASVSLTAFMFFILFFLSFAQVYQAQELVAHGTFQTVQSLAIESYTRETIGESGASGALAKLAAFVGNITNTNLAGFADIYQSLGDVQNLKGVIEKEFARSIADDVDLANEKLKSAGVVDGIGGLDFSESKIEGSVITVKVKYKVKLKFNFFGVKDLKMEKSAVCKSFASIKEDNASTE